MFMSIKLISFSNCDHIRSGSTGLKRSQVYPPQYGNHVARIHKNYIVWVSNWLLPRLPFPGNFQLQAEINGPNALRVALYDEQVVPKGRVLQVGGSCIPHSKNIYILYILGRWHPLNLFI